MTAGYRRFRIWSLTECLESVAMKNDTKQSSGMVVPLFAGNFPLEGSSIISTSS